MDGDHATAVPGSPVRQRFPKSCPRCTMLYAPLSSTHSRHGQQAHHQAHRQGRQRPPPPFPQRCAALLLCVVDPVLKDTAAQLNRVNERVVKLKKQTKLVKGSTALNRMSLMARTEGADPADRRSAAPALLPVVAELGAPAVRPVHQGANHRGLSPAVRRPDRGAANGAAGGEAQAQGAGGHGGEEEGRVRGIRDGARCVLPAWPVLPPCATPSTLPRAPSSPHSGVRESRLTRRRDPRPHPRPDRAVPLLVPAD